MSDNPFLDPEFLKCPFPMFKQLRDDAPIMFMEQMGMYLVTGYDQVREILLNPDRFSRKYFIVFFWPGSMARLNPERMKSVW